jgi:hypothetical protein
MASMLVNVLPALCDAGRALRDLLPRARHVWVDACERHGGRDRDGEQYARYANDRRFTVIDAVLGRLGPDPDDRPFIGELVRAGGEPLLELPPIEVDVLGLDYYAHCQWEFGNPGPKVPTPQPPPLASVITEYADRYQVPVALTETNLRGFPSDRVTWLRYVLEQCEQVVAAGVPFDGLCWFPFVDSCDWDSLLFRCEGNVDPVGVVSLGPEGQRHPTIMTAAYSAAAHGAPSSDLPAFRFQDPVAGWLAGYQEQMTHWPWEDPPRSAPELEAKPGDDQYEPLRIREAS